MGKITEQQQWEKDIYLIEKQDKVLGGELGVINIQAKQLANRTSYLKDQVGTINQDRTGYAPKASPAFTGIPTAPTAAAGTNNTQIATTAFVKTAIAALPQASNNINSNSTDTVATSATVKKAYDKATDAKTAADRAQISANDGINRANNAQITANSKQSPATTLAGYGIRDFKIENGSGNMNDFRTDGIYCFLSVFGVTNSPRDTSSDVWSGNLQVITGGIGNESWCHQIFHEHYSFAKYARHQIRADNDEWSPWVRLDSVDIRNLLIGVPIHHPLSTVPAGCLAMNGQRFDTRRYPKLAQKYPSGILPDLRGEFIRGWDNGRGVDAGRALLSVQGDEFKSHRHTLGLSQADDFNPGYWITSSDTSSRSGLIEAHGSVMGYSGGNETHPRNIAFHYICLAA